MTEADKPAFLQALARLAVALREPEPDVVQLRVFFEAMKDLDVELIAMAATQLAKESAWFPKTSEWRAMAAKIERKRTEELRALQRKLPEPLCLACEDTGWTRSDNRVHRCDCAPLRRLEILGRRPWPALPEGVPLADGRDDAVTPKEARSLTRRIEKRTRRSIAPREIPKASYVPPVQTEDDLEASNG